MNRRQWLLLLVLLDFVAITVWAFVTQDVVGYVRTLGGNPWGIQILLDLSIAITCASVWVYRDARERGLNPIGYIASMLVLGTIGLLVYLIRRESAAPRHDVSRATLAGQGV
ncbi:MAG: hypothetical protein KC609_01470 [Myxococcales bacterium]|nr:hypothetical protein [Myxococcales bacterium]